MKKISTNLFIIVFIILILPIHSERIALVVGNNDYEKKPLNNAYNDAKGIADILYDLDFQVIAGYNLDRKGMDQIVDSLGNITKSDDTVLFYYSGHAVQYEAENYLLPINYNIVSESDIKYEAFPLNRILDKIEKAKINLVFLDACRDNPFSFHRSIKENGLTNNFSGKKSEILISYATSQGEGAEDGYGDHSPYTKNLIELINSENKIEDLVKELAIRVNAETNNKQNPWISSSLLSEFYFRTNHSPRTNRQLNQEMLTNEITDLGIEMVQVKGGSFFMGTDEGDSDEKPVHKVDIDSFFMSEYEVTQELFNKVMAYNPSVRFAREWRDMPVNQVTWYESILFCNTLSELEGLEKCYYIDRIGKDKNNFNQMDLIKWNVQCDFFANGYRLPTEAEWEYAAQEGEPKQLYLYSGSNNIEDIAWFGTERNSKGLSEEEMYNLYKNNKLTFGPQEIGTKQANKLGIYDMSGNVWEWCWDWMGVYTDSVEVNPTGPVSGWSRVTRGGGFDHPEKWCRIKDHNGSKPDYKYYNLGIRLVKSY
ncbi:MAG: SUMF1/EgtB/PvdO family nonheme iron enzyme [Candidatus Cloacimonetes bacterium]|nr:SUMF1/EgtB/PvdO family nonheme iron enzyme [Candidatus Cloacimonadota bacterium]